MWSLALPSIGGRSRYWADGPKMRAACAFGATPTSWPDEIGSEPLDSVAGNPILTAGALGGRSALAFDGTGDRVGIDSWVQAQPFATIIAGTITTVGAAQVIVGYNSAAAARSLRVNATPAFSHAFDTAAAGGTPVSGTPFLLVSVANAASSKLIVNGTTVSTATTGTNAANRLYLGMGGSSTTPMTGHIAFCEVVAGDPTGHANWSTYYAWLRAFYGV